MFSVWSVLTLQETHSVVEAPVCDVILCSISDFGLSAHLWSFKQLLCDCLKPGKFVLLIGTFKQFLCFATALVSVGVTLSEHILELPFFFGYNTLVSGCATQLSTGYTAT